MTRSLIVLASLLCSGSIAAAQPATDESSSSEPGGERTMGAVTADDSSADSVIDDLDALDSLDEIDGAGAGDGGRGFRLHEYRYFAAVELRSYLVDRGLPSNDEQLLLDTELELDLRFARRGRIFFRPRFLMDAMDPELIRYEPLEGYISYDGRRTGVKLGQLIENWGVAEANNPLDVLNRRDFGADFLDPPRLGELGGRLTQSFDGGRVVGQPTLSAYFIALFRPTPLPTQQNRWRPLSPGLEYRPSSSVEPRGAEQLFGAVRFEHTLSSKPFNADVAYLVSRGPERFPYFLPVLGQNGGSLVPVYYGVTAAGLGMRAVPNAPGWGRLTFKLELAYKRPFELSNSPGERQDDYVQYTSGLDLLINPVFTDQDQILLTLEYAGENGASDLASLFRPFDADFAIRLMWEPLNFSRTAVELRTVVDRRNGELLFEGSFRQQLRFIHDDLRMTVTGTYLRASSSDEGFLRFFSNNSSISLRLQLDL